MAETIAAGQDLKAIERLKDAQRNIQGEIGKAIVGQADVIEGLMTALFANGHVLLVGVPGLAKTLLIRSLSRAAATRSCPSCAKSSSGRTRSSMKC